MPVEVKIACARGSEPHPLCLGCVYGEAQSRKEAALDVLLSYPSVNAFESFLYTRFMVGTRLNYESEDFDPICKTALHGHRPTNPSGATKPNHREQLGRPSKRLG